MNPQHDVIVIGGGPAGATAATLLARAGRRVLLAERSAEPVFKVGESLMPATFWIFERLGMLERLRQSAFPKKYSVQFFTGDGRASSPFYFFENDEHESSQTWQVLRSDFDALLLDNAREHGVEVRMGTVVREVLFDGTRAVGVRLEGPNDTAEERCRVVVDASGQSSLLARRFGLRQVDSSLKHVAYYTHFDGARRDEGLDEGATLVLHTEGSKSWFWFIPLPDGRASVGVVGPLEHLVSGRASSPQQVFDEELARCPALTERLEGARQVREMRAAKDFSYTSKQIAGDGWVLAGDAYGFLDPIYSSGVFLALKSGEMAADVVDEALAAGDVSEARLRRHETEYLAGMEAMKKLVYAFYDPAFSFGKFLKRHPEHRAPIVDLLVGNVFRRDVSPLLATLEAWQPDEEANAPCAAAGAQR